MMQAEYTRFCDVTKSIRIIAVRNEEGSYGGEFLSFETLIEGLRGLLGCKPFTLAHTTERQFQGLIYLRFHSKYTRAALPPALQCPQTPLQTLHTYKIHCAELPGALKEVRDRDHVCLFKAVIAIFVGGMCVSFFLGYQYISFYTAQRKFQL